MEEWLKEPNFDKENYKRFHHCYIPHKSFLYGAAVDECTEDLDGYLFVTNGEYGSQVNFCPYCGYKAKKRIEE